MTENLSDEDMERLATRVLGVLSKKVDDKMDSLEKLLLERQPTPPADNSQQVTPPADLGDREVETLPTPPKEIPFRRLSFPEKKERWDTWGQEKQDNYLDDIPDEYMIKFNKGEWDDNAEYTVIEEGYREKYCDFMALKGLAVPPMAAKMVADKEKAERDRKVRENLAHLNEEEEKFIRKCKRKIPKELYGMTQVWAAGNWSTGRLVEREYFWNWLASVMVNDGKWDVSEAEKQLTIAAGNRYPIPQRSDLGI
jgi:hypothetical protein